MGLSGMASGGANTNLTGLSPEQIATMAQTNVAGGKLGQESIQNMFENAQKMAYSDYLDQRPDIARQANEVKELIANQNAALRARDLERREADLNRAIAQGESKLEIDRQRNEIAALKSQMEAAARTRGLNIKEDAESRLKAKENAEQDRKDAQELEQIQQLFKGKMKDKQNNRLSYNPAHIKRFNELSPNEYAFEHVTKASLRNGTLFDNKEVKVVPSEKVKELYDFYIAQGGKGSFERFIQNPEGIVDQVYTLKEAKK